MAGAVDGHLLSQQHGHAFDPSPRPEALGIQHPGLRLAESDAQTVRRWRPCPGSFEQAQQTVGHSAGIGSDRRKLLAGISGTGSFDPFAAEKDRTDLSVLHAVAGKPQASVQRGASCKRQRSGIGRIPETAFLARRTCEGGGRPEQPGRSDSGIGRLDAHGLVQSPRPDGDPHPTVGQAVVKPQAALLVEPCCQRAVGGVQNEGRLDVRPLPREVARAGEEQKIGLPQREYAQHRKQHQCRDDQHRSQYAGGKAGRMESRPSGRSTRPRDDRLATVTRLRVLRRRNNMRRPSARQSVDSCRVWSDSFHRIFHRTIYLSSYKTEQSRYRSTEQVRVFIGPRDVFRLHILCIGIRAVHSSGNFQSVFPTVRREP